MLTLFFVDDLPRKVGSSYEFDSDDAQHAIRVLRMSAGETFMLSDGLGAWSKVKIYAVKKKSLEVEVIETGTQNPLEISFTVVQALPKGDRLKECIELLTEGGVDTIIPWSAQRSIGKAEKGVEKLQVTAREASKQSRRLFIPEVTDVANTSKVVEAISEFDLSPSLSYVIGDQESDILFGKNLGCTPIQIEGKAKKSHLAEYYAHSLSDAADWILGQ